MIAYLEGKIIKKEEDRILLLVNGVGYEILLPSNIMGSTAPVGSDDISSYYIYYHQTERQPKPVLIGFHLEAEKEFFQQFISVDAIGPMKAVKAMTIPAREIARAIEGKDVNRLKQLNGIGARTAQKIIASLEGKMGKFALINPGEEPVASEKTVDDIVTQVIDVLVLQLGYKSVEATKMVNDAMERQEGISTPEALFDEVYRGTIHK
jgi:Holliday junction DNA helicase RuvA